VKNDSKIFLSKFSVYIKLFIFGVDGCFFMLYYRNMNKQETKTMLITKSEALNLYPSLGLGLSDYDKTESQVYTFVGLTSHQKEAAVLAESFCGWHRVHVMEVCPCDRPPLVYNHTVMKEMSLEEWHQRAHCWETEHKKSAPLLAKEWSEEMNASWMNRVFEPLCTNRRGLTISAHDFNELY
jgi:hypothetical protein